MPDWIALETLAVLFAGTALGGMALFSFVMAPLVFRQLDAETAAAFMRAAFPRYYRAMTAITAVAAVLAWRRPEAVALAAVCLVFVVGLTHVLPHLDRLREGKLAGEATASRGFARLHRLSVGLNLVQMIVLLLVVLRLAA